MVRIILGFAAALIFGCANMGPRPGYEGNENHKEWIADDSLTKDEAYDRAINWIAVHFNSANDVIQLKDKENGSIVVKAIAPFNNFAGISYVRYTMQIKIKDQKAKFTFDLAGIAASGGHGESDNVPPQSEMARIMGGFENTKNNIVAEWASKKSPADF